MSKLIGRSRSSWRLDRETQTGDVGLQKSDDSIHQTVYRNDRVTIGSDRTSNVDQNIIHAQNGELEGFEEVIETFGRGMGEEKLTRFVDVSMYDRDTIAIRSR